MMTYLCGERYLDAPFQDVVSGDLYGPGELQILQNYVIRNLREHLLNLMGLEKTRSIQLVSAVHKS